MANKKISDFNLAVVAQDTDLLVIQRGAGNLALPVSILAESFALLVQDTAIDIDDEVVVMNFTGAGVTVTQTAAGIVEVAITSSAGGDMVLADVQTNTGAKTFEDGTMLLRNVADDFNGVFTNTNTADRTYTLPDATGVVALEGINVSDFANDAGYLTSIPTHTGQVTGGTVLTVDSTAISDQSTVTAATGDFILVTDADDSGNLKKVNASDFLSGGGDGNGIYDGSGSLTSPTVVTQGTSNAIAFVGGAAFSIGIASPVASTQVHIKATGTNPNPFRIDTASIDNIFTILTDGRTGMGVAPATNTKLDILSVDLYAMKLRHATVSLMAFQPTATDQTSEIQFRDGAGNGTFRGNIIYHHPGHANADQLHLGSFAKVLIGSVLDVNSASGMQVQGTKVVGVRETGWGAPTGVATRTTFATSTVTTEQLAERVHALIDDITTHGLIGS